nr:uncharacterized protein LOC116775001 [Danaus plexippus plexippus]
MKISVYAPLTGCGDVVKDKFREDFDAVISSIPTGEEIFIGRDFNGHVGRTNVGYERVYDKETWWWNGEVQTILKEMENVFKVWKNVPYIYDDMKEDKRMIYMECKKNAKRVVASMRAKVQADLNQKLESPRGQIDFYELARAREKIARDLIHIKCMKDEKR